MELKDSKINQKIDKKNPLSNNTEERFLAWVNNKMMVFIWVIQRNQVRDAASMLRCQFFLEEIEHHFMDAHADYTVWRAFKYLKTYLRQYPHMKKNRGGKALELLSLIYERLGFCRRKIIAASNFPMQGDASVSVAV